ncbi:SDR family NAD(P)-dependent oxidoreductase [Paenibacillus sp. NPDC058910]|uniref:SDR family NAD(P)-dependent oxidoreductase n=1 Tax=unclassified Paenibacillus TaxID=185978 RepID=UPI0036C4BB80
MNENRYGRIVNISSGLGSFEILQGFLGLKGSTSAYRISKTMLNALTCLVAQDVADMGIKVNAFCPGRVQTDMGGEEQMHPKQLRKEQIRLFGWRYLAKMVLMEATFVNASQLLGRFFVLKQKLVNGPRDLNPLVLIFSFVVYGCAEFAV